MLEILISKMATSNREPRDLAEWISMNVYPAPVECIRAELKIVKSYLKAMTDEELAQDSLVIWEQLKQKNPFLSDTSRFLMIGFKVLEDMKHGRV